MSGVVDSGQELGHGNIDANDPKLTSLAAAFRTALEGLNGYKCIWADAPTRHFSLSPDYRCRPLLAVLTMR